MKIAVINRTQSTGKTTLTNHLFAPRMPGARIVKIEDEENRADVVALKVAQVTGADQHVIFDFDTAAAVALVEHVFDIVDLLDGVDLWVIPRVPDSQQGQEAIETLLRITSVIPFDKVLLINNMAAEDAFSVKDSKWHFNPVLLWSSLEIGDPDFECQSNLDSVWHQIESYLSSAKSA